MSDSFFLLRLALPSPLRRLFDYLPPKGLNASSLKAGVRVRVPFGRRILVGILIEVVTETTVAKDKLKPVIELIDEQPIISPLLLDLCQWTANYYHYSLGETLACALPSLLRQGKYPDDEHEYFWQALPHASLDDPILNRATKQKRALQILLQHPHGLAQTLLGQLQLQKESLQRLQHKGLVVFEKRPFSPLSHEGEWLLEPELLLNQEQNQAVNHVLKGMGYFHTFLLNGVTGSGKTEVFFHLIHQILIKGYQALVLIPEINLSPQTLYRFQKRFNARIVLLHSALTDKERLEAWHAAKEGRVDILIGTRSAIFTPMYKLGLIVVDEEHDSSYKQQEGLRYHARDLAVVRARMEQVPVVLGSATPSLESLYNAKMGRYHLLTLTKRAGRATQPKLRCLDIRSQVLEGGISSQLQALIRKNLEAKQQVLIFINRRGFAPTLICHHCGWISHCPHCDARLTVHWQAKQLRCHHCDYHESLLTTCPQCHHVDLRPLGVGTERTEERLALLFAEWPIWRVDRDTTRRKLAMQEVVTAIHSGQAGILVGTQMLAKGHHFPNVTLVAILEADTGLFSADFRASEKMAQLITQVAGRAGRADKEGEVVIQTQLPDNPLIKQLINEGYLAFADHALTERKEAHWPPYSFLALLRAEAYKEEYLASFLAKAYEQAVLTRSQHSLMDVDVYEPVASLMERKAGRYRGQILIQGQDRLALHRLVGGWVNVLDTMPKTSQVRWSLDIDPIDLL